ncbi:MAG: hypothetical protein V4638_00955 [Bacteroidota bacterium]
MLRLFLFFQLCSLSVFSQIGTGQWRMHVPNRNAIDIAANGPIIYTAFESGLLEYNSDDAEKRVWTDVNGLSDITITAIYFSEADNSLFIGYENGNVDILKENTIFNVPAIKNAQIAGSKRINKFREYQGFIFIATGFGVIKFDPDKIEVKDSYFPTSGNESINDVTFRGDSIFALASSRLFRGFLNNPGLPDASQWLVDPRIPVQTILSYKELLNINDELYLLQMSNTYGNDSVFKINSSDISFFPQVPFSLEIHSMCEHNGMVALNIDGACIELNSDGTQGNSATNYSYGAIPNVNQSVLSNNIIWIADKNEGLVRYFSQYSAVKVQFEGPPKNMYYSMDWQDGKLAIAGGGLSGIGLTFSGSGFFTFEEEAWNLYDRDNNPLWNGQNVWDFLAVAINPSNTDQIAVGTFSEIPVSIFNNGAITDTFTQVNSTMQPSSPGGPWSMVSGLSYDESGNLWAVNGYSETPLNVLTEDGTWIGFDCGSSAKDKFSRKLVIDYNGNKWFSLEGLGVVGYNDDGTVSNVADDAYVILTTGANSGNLPSGTVNALAVDFDNEIWIGTDNGFAVLYNSESAFDATAGNYNAQRIKLEFEGNVEYVLGNTSISDIEVDGGNRKWMGTANAGIVLLSADGLEIIEQFTTDNSPLISNNIIDLEINHDTGELFIITDKGLVSYRTDATYEDPEYSDVQIFPNPVRPEMQGPITIQGIRYDSDVKITDVAGNLVYKTRSNGGTASWDGKTMSGERVATGVYLIWTAANEGKGRKVGKVLIIN